MVRLILLIRNNPWVAAGIALVIAALFGMHLPSVRVDSSTDGFMIEGDPAREKYKSSVKDFGSDNATFIYVKDPNLFDREKLRKVADVFYNLQEIEGVDRVEGIFNATNFKGVNGTLRTNPFFDEMLTENQKQIDQAKADALNNPLMFKNSITENGDAIALGVIAQTDSDEDNFLLRLSDDIGKAIKPLESEFEQVFQAGIPRIRRLISDNIDADQVTVIPLSGLVLLILLTLFLRSFNASMLPFLTGILSSISTLGFMALMGIPINVLTVIVPALILVIGSTEDMHIISEYYDGIDKHKNKKTAIGVVAKKTGLAISLTALTTVLGFLSTSLNEITLLKQFGITAAFGLFINFVITILIYPLYLTLFGSKKSPFNEHEPGKFFVKMSDIAVGIFTDHKKSVLVITGFLSLIAFVGLLQIRVDNNFVGYFKKSSEVHRSADILGKELSGGHSFNIVIEGKEKNTFKKSGPLQKIFELQKFIDKDSGLFGSSSPGCNEP